MSRKKKKFYAYLVDGVSGVADSWFDCDKIVSRVPNARFKGFETREEAKRWLDAEASYNIKHIATERGIYFDAGTGRGKGVEISITDEKGKSLLSKILPKNYINHHGKHWIFNNVTNNFGELLACKYALQIALKDDIKKIFGDSKLIIEHWSRGIAKRKELPIETVKLIDEVKKIRNNFEKLGGEIKYISGASNPADLGFHK